MRIESAGARAMPTTSADTRRNWSRLRRMSSCRRRPAVGGRCKSDPHHPDRVRSVADPVGAGFVESLARPGGNTTGFMQFEYGFGGKWLELLKEIAPSVTRAAVLRRSDQAAGIGQFAVIQSRGAVARHGGRPVNVRDAGEIERASRRSRARPTAALIVTRARWRSGAPRSDHRAGGPAPIARGLPVRYYVEGGGLISYGPISSTSSGRPAAYVDRILKGEKPADLPVQAPTKYELVDQPQDRQGARPRRAAGSARPRRRGDRIELRVDVDALAHSDQSRAAIFWSLLE